MRMLIIAFWIFVGVMLLWQFYTYNEGLKTAAIEHPTQTHFWFTNSASAGPVAPPPAPRNGPDVEQTAFFVQSNTPSTGSFTCQVTLKNLGNAGATNIQVDVRPYRGVSSYNEDVGHQTVVVLDDNDPISQFGQWLTFPDLAPGESSTQSVVFTSRTDVTPGANPKPQILFDAEKVPSGPAPSPHQPASN